MGEQMAAVLVEGVRVDSMVWPRQRLDRERVEEFADLYESDGVKALPPIEVLREADGWLLVEGHHRLAAAREIVLESLPALVLAVPAGVEGEQFAFERGVASAATSPKPLTRAEKRQAALRLLERYPHRHDRELARMLGVSHTFVANLRRQLATLPTEPGWSEEQVMLESAQRLASNLFLAMERVRAARGLGLVDKLFGQRSGKRLANVMRRACDEKALERAYEYRAWFELAIVELEHDSLSEAA